LFKAYTGQFADKTNTRASFNSRTVNIVFNHI